MTVSILRVGGCVGAREKGKGREKETRKAVEKNSFTEHKRRGGNSSSGLRRSTNRGGERCNPKTL